MVQKIKNIYHLLQAIAASFWYGFPSRGMTIIGVTGTDGKTTTTSLIYHLLKTSGKKTAMITTVGAYIGTSVYDVGFHVTTPSSFALQSYIKKAKEEGVTHLVLEVTSHALDQNRVWGIPFTIGVLTNITHEHLDYHKTYASYVAAKGKLLKRAQSAIVNRDDQSFDLVAPMLSQKRVVTYALRHNDATFTPEKYPFRTKLLGGFNKANTLGAIATVKELGVSDASIRIGLDTYKSPKGRMDVVYDEAFRVVIDFAHTPNAFLEALPAIAETTESRLIHVFGSAGLRDASKRPLMGKASAQYADILIITSEDPRSERVSDICAAIISGIPQSFARLDAQSYVPKARDRSIVFTIFDRKEAIAFALKIARRGDTVICTGKAHETSMNYDGEHETPWDEYAVVQEALHR